MPPDLVLVGHLAQDLQPDGTTRLGGTVTYAALLAARLGQRVGIITSAPALDIAQLATLIPSAAIHAIEAPTPTIFENRYHDGQRQQYLRARATIITAAAIPPEWRAAPMVLLGPIADEIAPDVAATFTGPFRAATPQGWLRAWDATGVVTPIPWHSADRILPHLTALILSVEDLVRAAGAADGAATVQGWANGVPHVVLTDGPRGATLWQHGTARHIPAFPVAESDPTGAGDCFATAFLVELQRTGDAYAAVRFAHAAASFVVQSPGTAGIPTAEQIAAHLAAHPDIDTQPA
jgi:1D-myo-inositol 3-kinase